MATRRLEDPTRLPSTPEAGHSADSRDAPLAHINYFLDDNGVPLEADELAVGEVGMIRQ
jgi:hypothetical protein